MTVREEQAEYYAGSQWIERHSRTRNVGDAQRLTRMMNCSPSSLNYSNSLQSVVVMKSGNLLNDSRQQLRTPTRHGVVPRLVITPTCIMETFGRLHLENISVRNGDLRVQPLFQMRQQAVGLNMIQTK